MLKEKGLWPNYVTYSGEKLSLENATEENTLSYDNPGRPTFSMDRAKKKVTENVNFQSLLTILITF